MPRVLALYAGRAADLATATGIVRTAIAKSPIHGPARVDDDGFPTARTGLHLRVLEPGELARQDRA